MNFLLIEYLGSWFKNVRQVDNFKISIVFLTELIHKLKFITFLTSPGSCLGLRMTSFHLVNRSAQLPSSSSVHSFCTAPDPDSSGSSSSSSSTHESKPHNYVSYSGENAALVSNSVDSMVSVCCHLQELILINDQLKLQPLFLISKVFT